MFAKIDSFVQLICKYTSISLLVLALPTMIIMVTLNVIGRYVFNAPIQGFDGMVAHLLAFVLYSSFAYCWIIGSHMKVEILQEHFGKKLKNLTETLAAFVGLVFFLPITIQNYRDLIYSVQRMEMLLDLNMPQWPFRLVAFAGASLMCLVLFLSMIKSFMAMTKGSEDTSKT